ncbi:hypothetical protein BN1058_01622 [Paraliobacillus sp. PM-2]|uniref:DHHW family protein n=1 Tax=Paraliobacillus sp. PM-2 TaxID=1462524 RepID=UPI00061C6A22|nr:DHHW family protein [Paraliobacillus sp. PM-2]CQR47313.1 hypothetical protein BN1058_01622 [Paraliobacillus sp. PM-2]
MRFYQRFVILSFILFLFIFGIGTLLKEDQTFSKLENRSLQTWPSFSWERLFSGVFVDEIETYIQDQFLAKTTWLNLKGHSDRLLLKKEVNGIVFGDKGYLFDPLKEPGDQFEKNIHYLNKFANNQDRTTYVMLAPTSVSIYPDKLPAFAPSYPLEDWYSNVNTNLNSDAQLINMYPLLKENREEKLYFRTDHHWTMRGAYYAYQSFAKTAELDAYKLDDFKLEVATNEFYGSFYRKVVSNVIRSDRMEVFFPNFPIKYQRKIHDTGEVYDGLYDWEKLNSGNAYNFFIGGNQALTTIETTANNNERIAVVKDSYAHAFIPFLANHYREIHVIDLRYFRQSLDMYLAQHEINETIILYNTKNFAEDTHIIWLNS